METHPPVLLLAPRITSDSVAMWKAAIALGWLPQRLQGWRVPDVFQHAGRDVIIYGEPLFAEAVADQLDLRLLEPSADWLTTIPFEYLGRKVVLMPLAEARALHGPAFVKPADGKIFDAKVYAGGGELPADDLVDQDIPVLRSDIVDFRLEVRCMVADRQPVSMSPYWRNEALASEDEENWPFLPGEEEAAMAFIRRVLEDQRVALPPACTLDVGRLADDSWAIIEANPIWGAGLYGCDPRAVLPAIGKAIVRRERLTAADEKWVSARRA